MAIFPLLSLVVTLAAVFSLVSQRLLRLPASIGTMILSLGTVGVLATAGRVYPGLHVAAEHVVGGIDFNDVVLHGMLALLLFAGALHLDLEQLHRQRLVVTVLAVGSTAISTVVIASGLRWLTGLADRTLGWLPALLFGALISPTDPIAVLEMLKRVGAPERIEIQLAGESLFNDGVGAVIFLAFVGVAEGGAPPTLTGFAGLLLVKAGGGILLGLALGYGCYRLLKQIDAHRVEIMLTLALAMGGYALADALRLSAPLEAVAAGLMVSGRARPFAMSELTREHVESFWLFVDEMLNVVLFLLLGLELLVLPVTLRAVRAALLTIPLVLLARWISVAVPWGLLPRLRRQGSGTLTVLTWGGLRGGLAVALALSLPSQEGMRRELLLAVTYVVVVFSILVQGLTIAPMLRWFGLTERNAAGI